MLSAAEERLDDFAIMIISRPPTAAADYVQRVTKSAKSLSVFTIFSFANILWH